MKRLQLVLGAIAVPVIVIAIGVAVLTIPPKQSATIDVPPDRATAVQVVRAFVSSVNAHDCDTAVALATADFEHNARTWCTDAGSLSNLEIGDSIPVRSSSGHRVRIEVSFDLKWRMFHKHADLADGHQDWGFELVATKGSGRWRIVDQGAE